MKKIAKKLLQVDGRLPAAYESVSLQPDYDVEPAPVEAAPEPRTRRPSLGALLLENGLATDEQVKSALTEGLRTGERLGEVVVRKGLVTDERIAELLATQWQLRFLKTDALSIDPMAMRRIPLAVARELDAVPISFDAHGVLLAIAEPSEEMFQKVQERIGDASYVVIARSALDLLLASRLLASGAAKEPEVPAVEPVAEAPTVEETPTAEEAPAAPEATAEVEPAAVEPGHVFADETPAEPEPAAVEQSHIFADVTPEEIPPVHVEPAAIEPVEAEAEAEPAADEPAGDEPGASEPAEINPVVRLAEAPAPWNFTTPPAETEAATDDHHETDEEPEYRDSEPEDIEAEPVLAGDHAVSTTMTTDTAAGVDAALKSIDTATSELQAARGELSSLGASLTHVQEQLAEREAQLEDAEAARKRDAKTIRKLESELSQRADLFDTLKKQLAKLTETVDTVMTASE